MQSRAAKNTFSLGGSAGWWLSLTVFPHFSLFRPGLQLFVSGETLSGDLSCDLNFFSLPQWCLGLLSFAFSVLQNIQYLGN